MNSAEVADMVDARLWAYGAWLVSEMRRVEGKRVA